jgi:hypothetical protein
MIVTIGTIGDCPRITWEPTEIFGEMRGISLQNQIKVQLFRCVHAYLSLVSAPPRHTTALSIVDLKVVV